MATTNSTWLKLKEVLDELHISRTTFDLWKTDGRTPRCYKLPNGQFRIRRIDLEAWMSVRTNPKWRLYDLRAVCASLLVNSGRAPAIVATEMGHSIEVLFERYLGSTANDASGGLNEIEEALK